MTKPTKAAYPDWPNGFGVVVTDEGYWTGSGFSQRLSDALKYPPCTEDHLPGLRAAAVACGDVSWLAYVVGDLY